MAKYRSQPSKPSTRSSASSSDKPTATDVQAEKKFFQVAIIVTLVVIALVYFLLNR